MSNILVSTYHSPTETTEWGRTIRNEKNAYGNFFNYGCDLKRREGLITVAINKGIYVPVDIQINTNVYVPSNKFTQNIFDSYNSTIIITNTNA